MARSGLPKYIKIAADVVPGQVLKGLATEDAVKPSEVTRDRLLEAALDVGDPIIIVLARQTIERGNPVTRIVEHRAHNTEIGAEFQHRFHRQVGEQMDLQPLMGNAFAGIVAMPLGTALGLICNEMIAHDRAPQTPLAGGLIRRISNVDRGCRSKQLVGPQHHHLFDLHFVH